MLLLLAKSGKFLGIDIILGINVLFILFIFRWFFYEISRSRMGFLAARNNWGWMRFQAHFLGCWWMTGVDLEGERGAYCCLSSDTGDLGTTASHWVSRGISLAEALRCQRPLNAMKNFAEAFTKSAGHDIVQDGIDGGVDVEHHPAEV